MTPTIALGALQRLADHFLEWRGDRVFLVDGRRLEFQALLGRVVPEQIAAASSILQGPGPDNDGLPSRRAMKTGRQRAQNQPLIPTPAGTYLRRLRKQGLPDLHRHHNGTTYPLLMWPNVLTSAGEIAEYVRANDMSVEFRRQIEALSGGTDERLSEQVYRVLDATRRLRAELYTYIERVVNDDFQDDAENAKNDDSAGFGLNLQSALTAVRDRHQYLDLARRPTKRTAPITEYVVRAEGTSERLEDQAGEERELLVDLIYRLAVDCSRDDFESGRREAADQFAVAAYGYLILQNQLLNALVHPARDAEGLARFVFQFFDHPFREVTDSRDDLRFEQANTHGAVDWLELRQSPHGDPFEKLRRPWRATKALRRDKSEHPTKSLGQLVDRDTRKEWAQKALEPDRDAASPGISTIFHFIREREEPKHTKLRDLFFGSGTRLATHHNPVRRNLVTQASRLRDVAQHPVLSTFFVGLDVAALETDAPTGVFAPMIRWLRSLSTSNSQIQWTSPEQHFQNQHVSRLGVTCHAGEDFRHLLGGIRSVDDSVNFLDMKQGDRIGHGLALGLDPETWGERLGGTVTMRIGRRFFDLIWFYDRLRTLDEHTTVAEQVRGEIHKLARRLYPFSAESDDRPDRWSLPTCEALEASRKFQKFDPRLADKQVALHPYDRFGQREIAQAREKHGERAFELWQLHMTNPLFGENAEQTDQFSIRYEWFDAIEAVQRAVMDAMTRREVAIEINPSSNRAVGGLDCLSEHPVFDWDPPSGDSEGSRPYVVVGSDDPGVFGSELLHEYAFLHAAARKRGHDRDAVESWLQDLRENGMRFLFMQEQRLP
ncbi:hypothetical protein [Salinibacter ruber]|uniref:hypothetical protein n=1 Tax=Salinibacter ruber TaxID=146919 RepID=UPI002168A5DC|nr:hypothetical protein [Salinibacter ruber]MCS3698271.1 hypothetical protein [Salinibacter ruber]